MLGLSRIFILVEQAYLLILRQIDLLKTLTWWFGIRLASHTCQGLKIGRSCQWSMRDLRCYQRGFLIRTQR